MGWFLPQIWPLFGGGLGGGFTEGGLFHRCGYCTVEDWAVDSPWAISQADITYTPNGWNLLIISMCAGEHSVDFLETN